MVYIFFMMAYVREEPSDIDFMESCRLNPTLEFLLSRETILQVSTAIVVGINLPDSNSKDFGMLCMYGDV